MKRIFLILSREGRRINILTDLARDCKGLQVPEKMKASAHVYTSAVMATALYTYSHSIWQAAICFASGILIDLDHVIDFHLFSGQKFSVTDFFSWYSENRWQKIVLIFHSYELFRFACAVAYYMDSGVLRAVLWGTSMHLLLDQIANQKTFRLSPWFYFLGYRIAVGFRREKLLIPDPSYAAGCSRIR